VAKQRNLARRQVEPARHFRAGPALFGVERILNGGGSASGRTEAEEEHRGRENNMEPGNGRVVRHQAEQRAHRIHESEDGHEGIDEPEDLEEHPRRTGPGHAAKEKDDSGSEMDAVVEGVDVENAEQHRHSIYSSDRRGDEPKNADGKKDDTEDNGSSFNHKNLLWFERVTLMAAGADAGKPKTWNKPANLLSKIDNMKKILPGLIAALGVLIVDLTHAQSPSPATMKRAVFAGGCFWCIQPSFDHAPGVFKTLVGYAGGTEPDPNYELVSSERTKYRESIEITYDPAKISYEQLLDIYWKQINPTQSDGQFTDIGPSYRAAIFYDNEEEKKIAEASKEKLARSGKFDKPIVTEILPAMKFYPAEHFHQKYYLLNPTRFEAFEDGSGRTSYQKKTWGKSP
jgi:methionine-S-sulfoxide reductase